MILNFWTFFLIVDLLFGKILGRRRFFSKNFMIKKLNLKESEKIDKIKRFKKYYNNENSKVENNTETKIKRKEISEQYYDEKKEVESDL